MSNKIYYGIKGERYIIGGKGTLEWKPFVNIYIEKNKRNREFEYFTFSENYQLLKLIQLKELEEG